MVLFSPFCVFAFSNDVIGFQSTLNWWWYYSLQSFNIRLNFLFFPNEKFPKLWFSQDSLNGIFCIAVMIIHLTGYKVYKCKERANEFLWRHHRRVCLKHQSSVLCIVSLVQVHSSITHHRRLAFESPHHHMWYPW